MFNKITEAISKKKQKWDNLSDYERQEKIKLGLVTTAIVGVSVFAVGAIKKGIGSLYEEGKEYSEEMEEILLINNDEEDEEDDAGRKIVCMKKWIEGSDESGDYREVVSRYYVKEEPEESENDEDMREQ
ncbi:MAG: hypothetical protein RR420_01035 [Anaerovoracaceae bacterium]